MVSWSDDVPLGMVPSKRYAPMPRPCRRGAKSSPRRDCSSGFRRSRIQLSITRQRLRNSLLSARANGGRGMAVAALPDGRRALSASADKTLKPWDLETGNPLAAFTADSDLFAAAPRRTIASLLARTMAGSIFYGTLRDITLRAPRGINQN